MRKAAVATIVIVFGLMAGQSVSAEQRPLLGSLHAIGRHLGIGYSAGYFSQRPTHSGQSWEAGSPLRMPQRAQPEVVPEPLPPVVRQATPSESQFQMPLPSLLHQAMRSRPQQPLPPAPESRPLSLVESLEAHDSLNGQPGEPPPGSLQLP